MNTQGKTLVSFLILVCYAMMAAGSNSDEYSMYIFILFFVLLGGYALSKNEKEKAARRAELAKEARAEKENENVQKLEELKVLFGEPTKIINYSHCKYFLLSEKNSQLMINEHIYKFRDVIDFNISDNSTVIYTPTTSITSTNTGNALTRAVVGGVLTGGVGAIIGGTTGSKTTVTKGGKSYTSHNYSILITVDSLTDPIEKIKLWSDEETTNTIAAILNIIVARNKKM